MLILAFLLKKWDANNVIALLEYLKDNIKLIDVNGYKRRCYPVLADFIVNYKEKVLITGIKAKI